MSSNQHIDCGPKVCRIWKATFENGLGQPAGTKFYIGGDVETINKRVQRASRKDPRRLFITTLETVGFGTVLIKGI